MDVSKSFDCIPHDLLISKLNACGVDRKFLIFLYSYSKPRKQPNGQIYVCGIFVKHSQDIFPGYSEKVPYEIPGNIPNNVPGILNMGIFPDCSTNILGMLHAFF